MSDAKASVHLPQLYDNKEDDDNFRKHSLALSTVICAAVNKYLEETEQAPDAHSIGAACYLSSYLIGMNFPDERKEQVALGLELCLVLNGAKSAVALANLPPQTTH